LRESYYEARDGGFQPTKWAAGPWDPRNQSGLPMSGLLAHLLDQLPAPAPMLLARVTIEILRPGPMAAFEASARIVRDGKRMQNLAATLSFEGVPFAQASALRVRLAETPASEPATAAYPSPEEASDRPLVRRNPRQGGMETRLVSGGVTESGPGVVWARPTLDLTPGVPVSPTVAAVMVSDMGSAVGAALDSRAWSFANLDLGVHFVRAPTTDWLLVDARTVTGGNGLGMVETVLADRNGVFGRAHQTLFIAPQAVRAAPKGETAAS
jgi:hypothetical protein